jgi:hypothetical protein
MKFFVTQFYPASLYFLAHLQKHPQHRIILIGILKKLDMWMNSWRLGTEKDYYECIWVIKKFLVLDANFKYKYHISLKLSVLNCYTLASNICKYNVTAGFPSVTSFRRILYRIACYLFALNWSRVDERKKCCDYCSYVKLHSVSQLSGSCSQWPIAACTKEFTPIAMLNITRRKSKCRVSCSWWLESAVSLRVPICLNKM